MGDGIGESIKGCRVFDDFVVVDKRGEVGFGLIVKGREGILGLIVGGRVEIFGFCEDDGRKYLGDVLARSAVTMGT